MKSAGSIVLRLASRTVRAAFDIKSGALKTRLPLCVTLVCHIAVKQEAVERARRDLQFEVSGDRNWMGRTPVSFAEKFFL